MATNDDVKNPKDEKDIADNNNSSEHEDTIGENAGDTAADDEAQPNVQDKPDDVRVKTVTPNNDNDNGGTADQNTSNKGQGPAGENL